MVKKLRRMMATAVVLTSAGAELAGAQPPLDRPSPPPCCADGICYPSPTTFGFYPTRWRQWPAATLQPTPAVGPTAPTPEIGPYEPLPKEEEDRAAPPPTKAAEEARQEEEDSGKTQTTPPPTLPFGPPQPQGPGSDIPTPGSELPGRPGLEFPWDREEPTTPNTTSPIIPPQSTPATPPTGGIPTGDVDPPPSLPFGRPSLANDTPHRDAQQPAAPTTPRLNLPTAAPRKAPSADPPPALPIALAIAN